MCHQTVSLVSHELESAGIATVIIGSARDIVEEAGAARFLFVDFPLGNPCGKPDDAKMQREIVEMALGLVGSAIAPRTTVQAPHRWGTDAWRDAFLAIDDDQREELQRLGKLRRDHQAAERTADS